MEEKKTPIYKEGDILKCQFPYYGDELRAIIVLKVCDDKNFLRNSIYVYYYCLDVPYLQAGNIFFWDDKNVNIVRETTLVENGRKTGHMNLSSFKKKENGLPIFQNNVDVMGFTIGMQINPAFAEPYTSTCKCEEKDGTVYSETDLLKGTIKNLEKELKDTKNKLEVTEREKKKLLEECADAKRRCEFVTSQRDIIKHQRNASENSYSRSMRMIAKNLRDLGFTVIKISDIMGIGTVAVENMLNETEEQ